MKPKFAWWKLITGYLFAATLITFVGFSFHVPDNFFKVAE